MERFAIFIIVVTCIFIYRAVYRYWHWRLTQRPNPHNLPLPPNPYAAPAAMWTAPKAAGAVDPLRTCIMTVDKRGKVTAAEKYTVRGHESRKHKA